MRKLLFLLVLLMSFSSFSQDEKIFVADVENKIQIGKLAGDRNLAFGVKNIIEEIISDEYYLVDNPEIADYSIEVDMVFLDVETSNVSIAILHQDKQSVVMSMVGRLKKGKKIVKKATATEKSSEVSMSTLVISEAGGFNQTSLSNALKKASVSLITKLLDGK